MTHRVLAVDNNPIIHVGLQQLLASTEFANVEAAYTLREARDILSSANVDLIITEFELPDGDCFELLESQTDSVPMLIFTGHDNPMYVATAVEMGMPGMVMKHEPPDVLIDALRRIIRNERIWKRRELRQITGALATPRLKSQIDVPLTRREYEVLIGVSQGMTNKKIAEELHISYETVKEHVQHILRKLGVADRTQAAVLAVRKGLL